MSGIIVIPVSPKNRDYIIGFRHEVTQNIKWGGNPYEAIQFESNRKDYHPRNSFQVYKETVKRISEQWLPQEIKIAEELRTAILEQIIKEKS